MFILNLDVQMHKSNLFSDANAGKELIPTINIGRINNWLPIRDMSLQFSSENQTWH